MGFFYFSNKSTGVVRWTPPPPSGAICTDCDRKESDDSRKKKNVVGSLLNFLIQPPKNNAYALELEGEDVVEEVPGPTIIYSPERTEEPTVAQMTFTGELPEKLFMRPKGGRLSFPEKAREIGVDPTGLTRQQLTHRVRLYWIKQHKDCVQSYLQSHCFKGMCLIQLDTIEILTILLFVFY